jgi:hypothetical protein
VERGGFRYRVSAPEDTILAKLRWAKLCGGSEKQMTDALGVYQLQERILDMAYIAHWAKVLDIEPLLAELQKRAAPL